jgi:hypothetical protein
MMRYLPATLRQTKVCLAILTLSCAPAATSLDVPPAPVVGYWPEYSLLPERQCVGRYPVDALERYLPRARLAMWLPGTRSVVLDRDRRCITVTVSGIGSGRLAELVMRGVAVPRRSVLLLLSRSERDARRAS